MNNPISSTEIEAVMKITPKARAQDQMASQRLQGNISVQFSSVQWLSHVRLFETP